MTDPRASIANVLARIWEDDFRLHVTMDADPWTLLEPLSLRTGSHHDTDLPQGFSASGHRGRRTLCCTICSGCRTTAASKST